jgi:tetratricopeptide (TPR) repeat protein
LLGVGTGNWKVAVLEKENQTSTDYTYKYKVHNDFLEITSESGIVAGLVFAFLFILILVSNAITLFKNSTPMAKKELVFLPMFGLIAYFFDAFFNFPHDRPEILIFFALAVGMSVGVEDASQKLGFMNKFGKLFNTKGFAIFFVALQIAGLAVLYMNFKSAQAQSIVYRLYKTSKPTQPADEVIKSFPSIPEISVLGEPIISNKAYALIAEERYVEAIKLLWEHSTSPFDSRREHYIAKCYYKMGNSDSALYWALKAYKLKPNLLANTGIITVEYQKQGKDSLAFSYIENYLSKFKSDEAAYELCAGVYYNTKNFDKTLAILDTGLRYLPQSKLLIDTKKKYSISINTTKYKDLFESSIQNMRKGNYKVALDQIDAFIAQVPDNGQAYGQRAFCHFYLKQYQKSIDDINSSFTLKNDDYGLLNLRGVNYRELGDNDKACADFKAAMDKGRADATDNFRKFCQKKP